MLTDKKLQKIERILGKDTVEGMNSGSEEQLNAAIVNAESAMKKAADELSANDKFQSLLSSVQDMRGGLRDLKARQNAVIQYALHLLEEKGK